MKYDLKSFGFHAFHATYQYCSSAKPANSPPPLLPPAVRTLLMDGRMSRQKDGRVEGGKRMSQLAGRKGEKEGREPNIIHYMISAERRKYIGIIKVSLVMNCMSGAHPFHLPRPLFAIMLSWDCGMRHHFHLYCMECCNTNPHGTFEVQTAGRMGGSTAMAIWKHAIYIHYKLHSL